MKNQAPLTVGDRLFYRGIHGRITRVEGSSVWAEWDDGHKDASPWNLLLAHSISLFEWRENAKRHGPTSAEAPKSSRAAEHFEWNLKHGLKPNEPLPLYCPRCGKSHRETLTNDPSQPDYFHHVHQCTECGLRFDVFVRCRSGDQAPLRSQLCDCGHDVMLHDTDPDCEGIACREDGCTCTRRREFPSVP